MIKKLTIGTLFLLFSSILTIPNPSIAQTSEEPNDTRVEKYEDLTETEAETSDIPETDAEEVSEDSLLEEGEEDMSEEDMSEEDMSENMSEEDMSEDMSEDIEDPNTRTEEKLEEINSEE